MHTYTPANSISDGPITNLLSVLCSLIDILSRVLCETVGTSIDYFSSDRAESMAVKGLKSAFLLTVCVFGSCFRTLAVGFNSDSLVSSVN